MVREQSTGNRPLQGSEQRKSPRVSLVIPVEVAWTIEGGEHAKESCETESVNTHGALLKMKTRPTSSELELTHSQTGESTRARVVRIQGPAKDGLVRVAVEFATPRLTFWGMTFPSPAGA